MGQYHENGNVRTQGFSCFVNFFALELFFTVLDINLLYFWIYFIFRQGLFYNYHTIGKSILIFNLHMAIGTDAGIILYNYVENL